MRITLAGGETLVRLTGTGAKNLAALLIAASSSREKTKGKSRLESMLKTGKELSVFTVPHDRLKAFAKEARRYGVLYTVVKEKGAPASIDLIVRSEDASKVNRIVERLSLGSVRDAPSAAPVVEGAAVPEAAASVASPPRQSREQARALLESITSPVQEPRQGEGDSSVPLGARPERDPRSASMSGPERNSGRGGSERRGDDERPSLRKRMREMEQQRRGQPRESAKAPAPKSVEAAKKGKAR